MPVSVVVGGQFGSEGKGKVSHWLAERQEAAAVVRVGGPNSGHTVVTADGMRSVFRQLPTAVLLDSVVSIVPAGAYIDADLLLREVEATGVREDRLAIDPSAMLVTQADRDLEGASGLRERLGSTLSGTGSAVCRRALRSPDTRFVRDEPRLRHFVRPTRPILRRLLDGGRRVLVEGTQGFGLSLLHSGHFPKVTSRDTTAAAAVSESGLSPLDVDEVVLVLRAFPIRVPGNSGPLDREIDWFTLTREAGSPEPLVEHTSVTGAVRRVARFDSSVVRAAISVNRPTRIVLNHLDYIDFEARKREVATPKVVDFVERVSSSINSRVDFLGVSPSVLLENPSLDRP